MSSLLKRMINRLRYAGESGLRAYEVACIHGFFEALPSEGRLILADQLRRYDRIQRSPNGKHVSFVDDDSDGLCSDWPAQILFPFHSKPTSVAEVYVKAKIQSDKSVPAILGEIFLFQGRFAGIEFGRRPSPPFPAEPVVTFGELSPQALERFKDWVIEARLIVDVMKAQ